LAGCGVALVCRGAGGGTDCLISSVRTMPMAKATLTMARTALSTTRRRSI
jgi:hypothetical protein